VAVLRSVFDTVRRFVRVLLQHGRVSVDVDAEEWKDVTVRRLTIEIKESLDRRLGWVVFEPNNEQTWERVRAEADQVLLSVWGQGKLKGNTPAEAFRVDRTTMTQNDIDDGLLVIVIGLAVLRPAEFVCIRIGGWRTAEAR
jgi:uncharacterized protein